MSTPDEQWFSSIVSELLVANGAEPGGPLPPIEEVFGVDLAAGIVVELAGGQPKFSRGHLADLIEVNERRWPCRSGLAEDRLLELVCVGLAAVIVLLELAHPVPDQGMLSKYRWLQLEGT